MNVPVEYTPHAASPDFVNIAVAIGRIEEGQRNLQRTVDGVDTKVNIVDSKVNGVAETVASHSVAIKGLEGRIDTQDVLFKERAPIRVPWTAIAAFILALISVGGALGFFAIG